MIEMNIKQLFKPIKPDWRKIVIFIVLFLVLPQKVSGNFIFFGGVFIIKSFFESYPPNLDLNLTIIILVLSYFLACFLVWIYDNKINKFIVSEVEVEVEPEKSEKIEQKPKEAEENKKE